MDQFLQFLYDHSFGNIFTDLDPDYVLYIKGAYFILIALIIGLAVRQIVLSRFTRLAARTANFYDDEILAVVKRRTVLWVVLLAAIITIPSLPWEPLYIRWADQILMAILVISITTAIVRAFAGILSRYSEESGTGLSSTTLIRYVGNFIFYALGLAIILSLFDISLLPAITALGVGGLAVALAFQDTLANLFAGILMTLSKQMRVGDYVEISATEQGYVHDISWRTTTLRTLANNLVVIPNKKMAESIVINYNLPEAEMTVEIVVGVSYDTDPEWLESILIDEVLSAVGSVEGLVNVPPSIRFVEFGDSALQMKIFPVVETIEFKFAARHAIMKRIYRRLKEENVTIPFPIRTIYMESAEEIGEAARHRFGKRPNLSAGTIHHGSDEAGPDQLGNVRAEEERQTGEQIEGVEEREKKKKRKG